MAAVEVARMRDAILNCTTSDFIFSLLDLAWSTQPLVNRYTIAQGGKTEANYSSSNDSSILSRSDSSCTPSVANEQCKAYCEMPVESAKVTYSSTTDESQRLHGSSVDVSPRESSSGSACTSCVSHDAEHKTTIDEVEMRRVFERFDTNADGLICRNELQKYMSRLGVELTDVQATSMIASVDRNNDDCVDFEEFLSLYETYCCCDGIADSDGAEGDIVDDVLEAFLVFDKNRDGFISAEELQAVLLDLGMSEGKCLMSCQRMIRNVDGDGNGKCDIEEFKTMMYS